MDNAWEYHDGDSEIRMGKALKGRRDQVFLMTKVCTHGRDAPHRDAAARRVAASGCRPTTSTCGRSTSASTTTTRPCTSRRAAWSRRSNKRGTQGKVRYVGFTGHKDPDIHLRMLAHDFPFDAASCR